jgi:predicted SprT family Zn-dependent metalloprotease
MILDPDVDDEAPSVEAITPYDEAHFITYARLLDAEEEGADWREVSRIVLHRDPDAEPDRTHRCWESHIKRARWMIEQGSAAPIGGLAPI